MSAKRAEVRPWGTFHLYEQGDQYWVKTLHVNAGHSISLQSHLSRTECWVVVRGLPRITIGDSDRNYLPGEKITIPQGIKHKIAAGNDGCIIVEVAYGVCDEEDIIRYEDQYGRAIPK